MAEQKQGLFVVFEGLDGSGKSTTLQAVAAELQKKGHSVCSLFEPTRSQFGQQLRRIFSGLESPDPEAETRLFIEDRRLDVSENIKPALQRGEVVLLDRYFYSSAAYQGRPPLNAEQVLQRNEAENFPQPDILFYIDVPVKVCLERMQATRSHMDFIETDEHLHQIAANYDRILPASTRRLNGTRPTGELTAECLETILTHREQP